MPKPKPDFLGLMDVMSFRDAEVRACRHKNCHEIGRSETMPFMVYEECLDCGTKFWKKLLSMKPEIASQARNPSQPMASGAGDNK